MLLLHNINCGLILGFKLTYVMGSKEGEYVI